MVFSIIYTDDMAPDTAGYASLWRIYIRPAYKDDKGILEHEKNWDRVAPEKRQS